MIKKNPYNPSKALFNKAFTFKKVGQDFFAAHLPKETLQKVDLLSIEPTPLSLIPEELQETQYDFVYKITIGGKAGYGYVFMEQRRRPDPYMPLRLLEYNTQLMRMHTAISKSKKLPVILNTVIHGGKSPYAGPTNFEVALDNPDCIRQTMCSELHLVDLASSPEEVLKKGGKAALLEVLLKQGAHMDMCGWLKIQKKHELMQLLLDSPYQFEALVYMLYKEKHASGKIIELLQSFGPEIGKKIVEVRQAIYRQGVEEGFEEGLEAGFNEGNFQGCLEGCGAGLHAGDEKVVEQIAKNMLEEGLELENIAVYTSLPLEALRVLQGRPLLLVDWEEIIEENVEVEIR